MGELPEEIVNHICCLAAKVRDPNPVVEELKTWWMEYLNRYKDDGMLYLGFDIDKQFPEYEETDYEAVKKNGG